MVICICMEDFYVTRTPRHVDICMKMSLAKYRGRKRGAYGLRPEVILRRNISRWPALDHRPSQGRSCQAQGNFEAGPA